MNDPLDNVNSPTNTRSLSIFIGVMLLISASGLAYLGFNTLNKPVSSAVATAPSGSSSTVTLTPDTPTPTPYDDPMLRQSMNGDIIPEWVEAQTNRVIQLMNYCAYQPVGNSEYASESKWRSTVDCELDSSNHPDKVMYLWKESIRDYSKGIQVKWNSWEHTPPNKCGSFVSGATGELFFANGASTKIQIGVMNTPNAQGVNVASGHIIIGVGFPYLSSLSGFARC